MNNDAECGWMQIAGALFRDVASHTDGGETVRNNYCNPVTVQTILASFAARR